MLLPALCPALPGARGCDNVTSIFVWGVCRFYLATYTLRDLRRGNRVCLIPLPGFDLARYLFPAVLVLLCLMRDSPKYLAAPTIECGLSYLGIHGEPYFCVRPDAYTS